MMSSFVFDNVGIAVRDIAASIEFYERIPGVRVDSFLDVEPRSAQVWIGEIFLYLFEVQSDAEGLNADGTRPGLDHISIRVPDVRQAIAECSDAGIDFEGEPYDEVDWGLTMVMTTDPDGVQIYLISDMASGV